MLLGVVVACSDSPRGMFDRSNRAALDTNEAQVNEVSCEYMGHTVNSSMQEIGSIDSINWLDDLG